MLSYGHLAFIASIIGVAVGRRFAVTQPTDGLGFGPAGFLYGGTALFLATFGYTRWRMFRLVSWTRLGTAAILLVLLPVAATIAALTALAVLALVLAGLNTLEHVRVERIGWRARLASRDQALPGVAAEPVADEKRG